MDSCLTSHLNEECYSQYNFQSQTLCSFDPFEKKNNKSLKNWLRASNRSFWPFKGKTKVFTFNKILKAKVFDRTKIRKRLKIELCESKKKRQQLQNRVFFALQDNVNCFEQIKCLCHKIFILFIKIQILFCHNSLDYFHDKFLFI